MIRYVLLNASLSDLILLSHELRHQTWHKGASYGPEVSLACQILLRHHVT